MRCPSGKLGQQVSSEIHPVGRGLRRASPVMGVRSWMEQGRRPRYSVPSFLGIEPRNGYNCGSTGWCGSHCLAIGERKSENLWLPKNRMIESFTSVAVPLGQAQQSLWDQRRVSRPMGMSKRCFGTMPPSA